MLAFWRAGAFEWLEQALQFLNASLNLEVFSSGASLGILLFGVAITGARVLRILLRPEVFARQKLRRYLTLVAVGILGAVGLGFLVLAVAGRPDEGGDASINTGSGLSGFLGLTGFWQASYAGVFSQNLKWIEMVYLLVLDGIKYKIGPWVNIMSIQEAIGIVAVFILYLAIFTLHKKAGIRKRNVPLSRNSAHPLVGGAIGNQGIVYTGTINPVDATVRSDIGTEEFPDIMRAELNRTLELIRQRYGSLWFSLFQKVRVVPSIPEGSLGMVEQDTLVLSYAAFANEMLLYDVVYHEFVGHWL